MGEALDLGTCKAKKKNGEPCTQIVNLVGLSFVGVVFAKEKLIGINFRHFTCNDLFGTEFPT